MKIRTTIAVLVLGSFFASLSAFADNYVLIDLGVLPGFIDGRAAVINNQGQIVGRCEAANNISHAFLWENGQMVDLGTFGGSESLAEGINESGEIVGAYISNGKRRAFLLQNGRTIDLGIVDDNPKLGGPHVVRPGVRINNAGQAAYWGTTADGKRMSSFWDKGQNAYFGLLGDGTACYAEAINDKGQIVGVTHRGDSSLSCAFLWQNGVLTKLETLGGTNAAAHGINNLGTVIGWSTLTNGTFKDAHAFVWKNGNIQDLGTLGGRHARAYGINNADQIVGYTSNAQEKDVAFLWENGRMFNLNDLVISNAGWQLRCADAINDRGQIVALAWKDGVSHASLLSPVSQINLAVNSQTNRVSVSTNLVASPFRLSSFERLQNGDFKLIFSGVTGSNYFIEASTNLTIWTRLGPATINAGALEFVDADASKFILRFYRAVLAQ